MNEDPVTRLARIIAAFTAWIGTEIDIVLLTIKLPFLKLWFFIKYLAQLLWLRIYWGWLYTPLVLLGLKKELTWSDIEAKRQAVNQQYRLSLPRTPELEKGLKQEQKKEKEASDEK